ncbi:MAG: 3-deoxy-8-phosphooctulonate synthase [Deltaproteobacteria bacterium]|nr:3-deoxy-8-phosphooctulonate synthase [Deltaproteobacteria bacterium]
MVPLIVGLCVIEDEGIVLETAQELKKQLQGLPVQFYFKASFDKANRTSLESFRGPGLIEGLKILDRVKTKVGVALCTDFHTPDQAVLVAELVDVLQVPAFLCRQTDMIVSGAKAALKFQRKLNIKKGQFLSPKSVKNIVEKVRTVLHHEESALGDFLCITERGVSFGYNDLVVDMTSFQCIKEFGVSVIYDVTHSIQVPGGALGGKATGGKREYLEVLARAAVAAGADGIFMECHPNPPLAKSDGPNAFYLEHVGAFVKQLLEIKSLVGTLPRVTEGY